MRYFYFVLLVLCTAPLSQAQPVETSEVGFTLPAFTASEAPPPSPLVLVPQDAFRTRSLGAAFGLSLILPGAGHRYARGTWAGAGTVHSLADAGLWAALLLNARSLDYTTEAYEQLAVAQAGISLDGKDRAFFLDLARYDSSEDYIDALQRERRWDQLAQAQLDNRQWMWTSTEARERYATLRDDAESLKRQRPFYGVLLVTNRLAAAIGAVRATRTANREGLQATLLLQEAPVPYGSPHVGVAVRW